MKRLCRELAQQAGMKAAEQGFSGVVLTDDDDHVSLSVRPRHPIGSGEETQQIKDYEMKIDQISRDLNEKTKENQTLINEIRQLEQGLREIQQQLKQKRLVKSSPNDSQTDNIIQCPSLDRLLQVKQNEKFFFSSNRQIETFRFLKIKRRSAVTTVHFYQKVKTIN